MSSAAGFSPNIMAVPKAEFEKLRTEFARSLKSKEELEKEDREEYIPQELEFLSDVVEIEDEKGPVDLFRSEPRNAKSRRSSGPF